MLTLYKRFRGRVCSSQVAPCLSGIRHTVGTSPLRNWTTTSKPHRPMRFQHWQFSEAPLLPCVRLRTLKLRGLGGRDSKLAGAETGLTGSAG